MICSVYGDGPLCPPRRGNTCFLTTPARRNSLLVSMRERGSNLRPNNTQNINGSAIFMSAACLKVDEVSETVPSDSEITPLNELDEPQIPYDVVCSICSDVFCDPVCVLGSDLSTGCQHTYCRECLNNWQRARGTCCPLCRDPLANIVTDRAMMRRLASLNLDSSSLPHNPQLPPATEPSELVSVVDELRLQLEQSRILHTSEIMSLKETIAANGIRERQRLARQESIREALATELAELRKQLAHNPGAQDKLPTLPSKPALIRSKQ